MYVVASVAVARNGVRLGKGYGYAEMEWGILYRCGIVGFDTFVATTVHHYQILEDDVLSTEMMEDHDLPVDLIVTARNFFNTKIARHRRVKKPAVGIVWSKVTDSTMEKIPALKALKEMEEQRSKKPEQQDNNDRVCEDESIQRQKLVVETKQQQYQYQKIPNLSRRTTDVSEIREEERSLLQPLLWKTEQQ